MWQKYEACVNCGTTDHPHRGRGYCNKCHGPAMQLEEIRAWDQFRSDTLRRYPGNAASAGEREFALVKEGFALELQRRLDTLKDWEASRNDPVDGIEIEFQLDRIARYVGAKTRKLYHGLASYIDNQFSPAQRIVLRELLRRIEKDRPWQGVNLYRVFEHKEAHLLEDVPESEG